MYDHKNMSHDDRAKIATWSAALGTVMTVAGWLLIGFASDKGLLLIPTTFTIITLSLVLANNQYDEFHRAMAHSGAIGGMMAVLLWTAFTPLLTEWLGDQNAALNIAKAEPRVIFFIAASGFFIGFYNKQFRGGL